DILRVAVPVSRPPKEDPQQRPDDACTDEPDPVGGGLTPHRHRSCSGNAPGWRTGFLYI
ncbi:unnamed protein product, partial [Tetraodon nigroviridis]